MLMHDYTTRLFHDNWIQLIVPIQFIESDTEFTIYYL